MIMYFYYRQRSIVKHNDNLGITPSDFTVMVSNLHDDDPDSSIESYIQEMIKKRGFSKPVKIYKINRANFKGNIPRIQ